MGRLEINMASSRNIDVTKKIVGWVSFSHRLPPARPPSPSPLLVAGCNDYGTKWGFNLGFGVGPPKVEGSILIVIHS